MRKAGTSRALRACEPDVQLLEIQVEIDSHHWQPRCPPWLRTGSFAPSPRDEFAVFAAPVSWHMFNRSVNRKYGGFALQLNEMARPANTARAAFGGYSGT